MNDSTLLTTVLNDYVELNKKKCTRLIFTATFSSHVKDMMVYFNTFIQKNDHDRIITGICFIINDKSLIHCIESSTEIIKQLLRDMNEKKLFNNHDNKIVIYSEDINRAFPIWALRKLSIPPSEYEIPHEWLDTIFSVIKGMLELGKEASTMSYTKALDFLTQSSARTFLQDIPTYEMIKAYNTCSELFSIQEWLKLYDNTTNFTLEEELIYPASQALLI